MISVSESARVEILKVLEQSVPRKDLCVRIGIKGTSCDGAFIFGLDTQKAEDELFTIDNIPIIVKKNQLLHVIGSRIDFNLEDDNGAFTVKRV